MRRVGIRMANALLFVLVCLLLASILNQWTASALTVPPSALPAVARTAAPARASWTERSAILERNLFGSATEADVVEEVVEVEVEEVVEETKLPLVLLGTAATLDPQYARATISNKSRSQHEVVQIGDRLMNFPLVRVEMIEPRRVVLLSGLPPLREELVLDEKYLEIAVAEHGPVLSTPQPRPERPTRPVPKARPSIAKKAPPSKVDLVKTLEALGQQTHSKQSPPSPQNLFQGVKVEPEYEGAQLVGLVLSFVKPGSRLEQLGLKDGDLVTEINGVEITDPVALQQASVAMSQGSEIRVTVNGRPLVINAEKLTELEP